MNDESQINNSISCNDNNCTESSCLLPKSNNSNSNMNSNSNSSTATTTDSSNSNSPQLLPVDTHQQCSYVPKAVPAAPNRVTRVVRSSNFGSNSKFNNGGVNFSTNTLLVFRLQDMRSLSNTNLCLAVLCLVYLGINVTLVCVNYINDAYVQTHGGTEDGEPVDDTVYHLVEFWATFCFAVIECLALCVTPKSQYSINGSMDPLFLKMVMFVNIVATSVPAVMISFTIETFERTSHEIEYINELTMSFVDVILLGSLWNSRSSSSNNKNTLPNQTTNRQAWATTTIALLVAVVQLGVYNLMGYDETRDDMVGEVPAHFLEFSFEIISSLIAFWFCMDNKAVADREIGMILYGNHEEDCQICNNQVTEFALDNSSIIHQNNNKLRPQASGAGYQQQPSSGYYQTV